MYLRSVTKKLNLLTILFDNEVETYNELTELNMGDPFGYIREAKALKNIYRNKILNIHIKSISAR